MADKPLRLECTIADSQVTLGSGRKDKNKVVVRLKNEADEAVELSERGAQGTLSVAFSIGTQAKDLVDDPEKASKVSVVSGAGWEQDPFRNISGQATCGFRLPDIVFGAKKETSLTLTNFECDTDPGNAQLIIKAEIGGYETYEKGLEVEKKSTDALQILYFRANPPQIVTPEDRTDFALEWNTIKARTVSLYKGDKLVRTLNEREEDSFRNKERFSYSKEKPDFDTIYKLVAIDANGKTEVEKQVTVLVLKPGWHRFNSFRERFGYPSALCNMDGAKLYGVFVKEGKACLYSSSYPAVVWDRVTSEVPEGMATSPAVCFANQLWLVGGSTANPRNCSNHVWSYAPDRGRWTRQKDAGWTARMGHCCVVFDKRVWVIGGMDEAGNALNDVWNFDTTKSAWTCTQAKAAWSERCMHAATAFRNRIWIYGGVKVPFGDSLADIWRSGDGQNWEQYTTTDKNGKVVPCVPSDVGKPIACALQVVNHRDPEGQAEERLQLLGTFRSGATTKSWKCILAEGQRTWNCSLLSDAEAWHQQSSNTFSLSSAEYKGLVFVRSLNYETANNPTSLNVYVP